MPESAPATAEFDGQPAFRYIETQVAFGPRIPGTEAHRREAAWLDSLLRQRADTLITQSWTHVTATGDSLPLTKFVARFKPAAPTRLLFLAHWDSRPRADSPTSADSTKPVPGANDGGSGVAVLLGVADVLKRAPPAIGVDLLFVDGEDYGDFTKTPNDVLIGSRYYAAHQAPGPQPLYAVLFDLVADKDLQIFQEGNSLSARPRWWSWCGTRPRTWATPGRSSPRPSTRSSTTTSSCRRPASARSTWWTSTIPSWHTKDDTIDKVSAASLQIVGDVAVALVRRERGVPLLLRPSRLRAASVFSRSCC